MPGTSTCFLFQSIVPLSVLHIAECIAGDIDSRLFYLEAYPFDARELIRGQVDNEAAAEVLEHLRKRQSFVGRRAICLAPSGRW